MGTQRVGPGGTRGPGGWQARCVRGVYKPEQGPRMGDRRQEGAGAVDRSQASTQVSEGGTRWRLSLQEETAL